jgi:hypothetical protein
MKKGLNLRNKRRNERTTQGRGIGKEKERKLEFKKINTKKLKTWDEKRLKTRMKEVN